MSRRIVPCAVLVGTLFIAAGAFAQSGSQEPLKVLLIGNSQLYYNQGVGNMLNRLSASDPEHRKILATELTYSWATLKGVWDHYAGKDMLPTGRFDVVVIQDNLGWYPGVKSVAQELAQYSRIIDRWAKDHGSTRTILLMEATYLPPSPTEYSPSQRDEINRGVAAELGAEIAPFCIAWVAAWEQRPSMKLIGPDGEHPTRAGTYLIACVLYATITKESPVGISYAAEDVFGVDRGVKLEEAPFLQRVAWDTCVGYGPPGVTE